MRSHAKAKSGRPAVAPFAAFGGASVLASRRRRVLTRPSQLVSSLAPPNFATGRQPGRCLAIDWHDRAWRPRLVVRLERKAEGGRQKTETIWPGLFVRGGCISAAFHIQPFRRNPISNL